MNDMDHIMDHIIWTYAIFLIGHKATEPVELIVRILSRPLQYTGQSSCRSSSDYPRSLIKGKNKVFDSKLEDLYLEVTAQTEQGHLASKNL